MTSSLTDKQELDLLTHRANTFMDQIMPQMGKIVIQDYGELNQMLLQLTQLKEDFKNGTR